MDTVPLVDNKIEEGQRLLDRLSEEGFVVRAACWLKRVDRDRWLLYIASPTVDEKGTFEAYGKLAPILQSLNEGWLNSSDVTMVGEKHPLVEYANDILLRFPHKEPIGSPRSLRGSIPVEEVYVYPLGKTPVTIYSMVFPGAPEDLGFLSFEELYPHVRLKVDGKEYAGQTGINYLVAAPKGATLERDDRGQMVLTWDNPHGMRMKSTAKQVLAFAEIGGGGFSFLKKPA